MRYFSGQTWGNFHDYAQHEIHQHPGIITLSWITHSSNSGADKDDTFSIELIAPRVGGEIEAGFDLAASPELITAIVLVHIFEAIKSIARIIRSRGYSGNEHATHNPPQS